MLMEDIISHWCYFKHGMILCKSSDIFKDLNNIRSHKQKLYFMSTTTILMHLPICAWHELE